MKDQESRGVDRREFLRTGITAAAAVAGAGTGAGLSTSAAMAAAARPPIEEVAETFLEEYVRDVLPLMVASNEASWTASTDVSEAHSAAQASAMEKVYEKAGARRVIEETSRLLGQKDQLDDLTIRQLEKVRLAAAEAPGTLPDVVRARTQAEAKQAATQDGFTYTLKREGKPDEHPSANAIDRALINSRDLDERLAYWQVAKTIGEPLRPGILRLRDLRNQLARAMGFDDFFALQVADYGMTTAEMIALCDRLAAEVKPLYAQLHAWAKHALAKRYKAEPPAGKIPAHWLPNRWGQNWPGLVEGVDMDAPFKGKTKEYIAEQAERFYVSLGFPKLPPSFWRKSDLYPADPKSGRKKNSHASAWHIDLREDVRSLMSIEPNNEWFGTAHHELGHIYYYISYSRPEVPYLLRAGANRAFHEGVGDLIGLASGQRPYLKSVGLLTPEAEAAPAVNFLLDTALDGSSVVFLPFAAGTMTHFERDFYAGTIADAKLNEGWWDHVGAFQGIAPPGDRPETLCDPATKTHINDDPAQYYDYAIGTVIKFQLHDHIAREILKQDPRDCNYFGDARVGEFLRGILRLGATRDWNAVLREATGESLTARPMVAYFEPLMEWLKGQNAGRPVGWQ
ncbi:M2 family metallopeptidase [Aquisphaera insulae]|uniref:M2 family metallopeptidase n=1 Tax=Aquisphaera insulae TaxID=2712864 RepID=UPI0013ED2C65|nr:M2 family metallopeptidase [Aquisphaera insulae]